MSTFAAARRFAKNITRDISVEEVNGKVHITGVKTDKVIKDFTNYFGGGGKTFINNIFITQGLTGLSCYSFFLIDVEYIFRKLSELDKTHFGKRNYLLVLRQLKENTWLKKLTIEHPSIFNTDKLKELKFPLLKHQQEFLEYYNKIIPRYGLKGLLFAGAAGSGKTIGSLSVAVAYESENVIIIAPKNTVYRVWEETIKTLFVKEQSYWIEADRQPLANPDNTRFFVFHYESIDKAFDLVHRLKDKKATVILDESHNLNDIKSLRTERFIALCNSLPKAIIVELSGTPMKALGYEAIPLLKAVDPLFTDECLASFKKMYGKNATKATEVLSNRLGILMYKVESNVAKIEAPVEHEVLVQVPDADRYTLPYISKQMEIFCKDRKSFYTINKQYYHETYWGIIEYWKEKYERIVIAPYSTVQYIEHVKFLSTTKFDARFHADIAVYCNEFEKKFIIPNLPNDMKKLFRDCKSVVKYVDLKIMGECLGKVLSKARIECNKAIINNLDFPSIIDNAEKKTLIFTSYVDVVNSCGDKLAELGYNPIKVFAETNSKLPMIVKEFSENEKLNPLIATYQSLSTGVPMTMANCVILLNAPFRAHEKEQTVARANRLGQDRTVHVYNVFLDTGNTPNISTRSKDIMEWSKEQVAMLMGFENNINVGLESFGVDMTDDVIDLNEYVDSDKVGQCSDGHHTFDELYYHRMVLFSVICNSNKDKAWKSKLHSDGTMFDGYFIVGITTDEGEYTYHYQLEHWDKFDVKELENAPEWDGHTPSDITRLMSLV